MKYLYTEIDLYNQTIVKKQVIESTDHLKGLVDFKEIDGDEEKPFLDYIAEHESINTTDHGWVVDWEESLTIIVQLN